MSDELNTSPLSNISDNDLINEIFKRKLEHVVVNKSKSDLISDEFWSRFNFSDVIHDMDTLDLIDELEYRGYYTSEDEYDTPQIGTHTVTVKHLMQRIVFEDMCKQHEIEVTYHG